MTQTTKMHLINWQRSIADRFEIGLFKAVGVIADRQTKEGTGTTYLVRFITSDGYLVVGNPHKSLYRWHEAEPCSGHQLTIDFE